MGFDVELIRAMIVDEVSRIGLLSVDADVDPLDDRRLLIAVTSASFEGQTYLDRELRIRPAIMRALAACGEPSLVAIIDTYTVEERTAPRGPVEAGDEAAAGESAEDRVGRSLWAKQIESTLLALRDSNYDIHPVEDNRVYIATRSVLSDERVVVAFARSPRATTIDIDARRVIDSVKQSQRLSKVYYVAPDVLSAPFANQRPATWIAIVTPKEFLHTLNASEVVARNLLKEFEDGARRNINDLAGPVVEPNIIVGSDGNEQRAFSYLRNWISRPECSFLLLMAPGGHGKTTIATELTRQLCVAHLEDASRPLPLLVGFQAVRRTVDFEALLHKRLAELRGGGYGAFRELLKQNAAILIVDGFDELTEDAGVGVAQSQVRNMRSLLQGSAKIVLAGRTAFADQFANGRGIGSHLESLLGEVRAETAELQPFDEQQIEQYISTRAVLREDDKTTALAFAKSSSDVTDLCSNPLLLAFTCSLAASKGLPDNHSRALEGNVGIDTLLDRVCVREEERQQLGLGLDGQFEYLSWLAVEMFHSAARTKSWSVSSEDARSIAGAVANQKGVPEGETVERLLAHALITTASEGRRGFVHPLVRDVIIGRSLAQSDAQNKNLEISDIPEGAAKYIAARIVNDEMVLARILPDRWLAESVLRTQTRRNLFRIAQLVAKFSLAGNPRHWMRSSWTPQGQVSGIDFNETVVESLTFDNLSFRSCSFNGAVVYDCDFRGASFDGCRFEQTLFINCRWDRATRFHDSLVAQVVLADGAATVSVRSEVELLAAISEEEEVASGAPMRDASGPTADVVAQTKKLVIHTLHPLAEIIGEMVKFHDVSVDGFRARTRKNVTDAERSALDAVIIPGVSSKLCVHRVGVGSADYLEISKQWRPSVIDLLRSNRATPRMAEFIGRLAGRAARYL